MSKNTTWMTWIGIRARAGHWCAGGEMAYLRQGSKLGGNWDWLGKASGTGEAAGSWELNVLDVRWLGLGWEPWMETGVSKIRRSNDNELCGVGGRAREQGDVGVTQAGAGEGKGSPSFTPCLPSHARLGVPYHVSLLSAHLKASISPMRETYSPPSMLIHIKDDNQHLLSITSLVWISWKLFLHPRGIQPGLSSMTGTTW